MSDQSYSATFLVDRASLEVFAATNVREWWSADGPTDELGGEFTYHNELRPREIVDLFPDQRVVWLCLENDFNFIRTPRRSTRRIDITQDRRDESVTHLGLVRSTSVLTSARMPGAAHVTDSPAALIVTGTGNPNNAVRNAEALSQRR